MISILLSDKGSTPAQAWWWKFLHGTDKRSGPLTTEERIEAINLELLNWSAQLWRHEQTATRHNDRSAYIDFYDEQAYTWFVLRWS